MRGSITLLSLCLFTFSLFSQSYGNEWIDYNRTYYEISVDEDGWVHIPQSTLLSLGLPLDASKYELITGGEEQALYVSTEGILGADDYLAFLGKKNDGAFDKQLYKQAAWQPGKEFSLFSQTRAYYLSVNENPESPKRYQVAQGSDPISPERFYNTSVLTELHNVFHSGKPFNIGGIDNTFSEFDEGEGYVGLMIEDEAEFSQFMITREPYYENGGQAIVNVEVIGRSNDPFVYLDHHLNIELNDQFCNSIIYPGFDREEVSFPVPISQLELISRFKFTSVGDLAEEKDRSSLISLEVEYPRYYRYDEEDNFPIYYTDLNEHSFRAFGLDDWSNTFLLDAENAVLNNVHLRNGKRFFHIDEAIGQPDRREAWFIDPDRADRTILATQIETRNFVDFSSADHQGDFILLSNQLLSGSELDAYDAYRSSEAGGSHTVSRVWINELYDQFAQGIENHPLAIRNFVNYAVDTWDIIPQHLLLVGKSLDYRNLTNGQSQESFVPTYGFPPSDFLLTTRSTNDNVPQLAVGRIPARDKSQIQNYLDKVIEIESLEYNDCDLEARSWTKNVFHAVSGYNDTEANYFVSFLNDLEPIMESSAMGGEILRTLIQSGIQIDVQDDLPALMEEGIALISYMGHPTTDGTIYWNFDIEAPEFYDNPGRYPIINANSCFSGNIHHNGDPVMAEEYVLADNRGAIGYIAIVNFGWPTFMQPFNIQLYEQLGNNQYGGEIGKVIQAAYTNVYFDATTSGFDISPQLKQLHSLVYAGDPAMRTFSHSKPDYHIEAALASVSPTTLTTSQDSFLLKLTIENTGRGMNQDLDLRVNRVFADGTSEMVFDETISAPSSKLIKTIEISNPENLTAGANEFVISLDPNNTIDELCEENNDLSLAVNIEGVSCPEFSIEILDFPVSHCIDDIAKILTAEPAGGEFFIDNKSIGYHAPAEWGPGAHFLEYVYTDPTTQCAYSAYLNYEIQGSLEQTFVVQQTTCVNTPTIVNLEGLVQEGVTYHWQFGENADVAEAFTPGPHAVTYNAPGSQLVTLSLSKDGCTFDMNAKQVFVEEALTPVTINSSVQSGNTITIDIDTDDQVNYYTIQINGISTWNFFPDSTYVIEDLEPETEYIISLTPLGNFTVGNSCAGGIPSNVITVSTTTCPDLDISVDGLEELYCSDNVDPVDIFTNPFGGTLRGNGVEEVIQGSMSYRFYPNRAGAGTHTIMHEYFDEVSGCKFEKEYEVVVAMNPFARITGDAVVCEGSTTLLIANPGMEEYVWDGISGSSNVLEVENAGSYELEIIDERGCRTSTSIEVTASATQAPEVDLGPDIVLDENDASDTLLDAGPAASYLWSTLETSQTIYAEPGTHSVVAYNEEGCPGRDEISIEFLVSGIEDNNHDLSLGPIPVIDYLSVRANEEISEIAIYDLTGRSLLIRKVQPALEHKIALSDLPNGYFIIEMQIGQQRISKKISAFNE